jgi:hypothetical protein
MNREINERNSPTLEKKNEEKRIIQPACKPLTPTSLEMDAPGRGVSEEVDTFFVVRNQRILRSNQLPVDLPSISLSVIHPSDHPSFLPPSHDPATQPKGTEIPRKPPKSTTSPCRQKPPNTKRKRQDYAKKHQNKGSTKNSTHLR